MKIWWSKNPAPGNFGDILTPYILRHFNISFQSVEREQADTLCIGSIAKYAKPNMTMLGTGAMRVSDPIHPEANWLFVRGPHTRDIILRDGGRCPKIYGDAALLLPLLVPDQPKIHDIGIVPHYVDQLFVRANYPEIKIINLLNNDPLSVAQEIASCKKIISSSLHGIIAAHAYNIPAAWVKLSDDIKGDGIKYHDHYASIALRPVLSTLEKPVYQTGKINIDPIQEILCSL
jgi:hypothetical protein